MNVINKIDNILNEDQFLNESGFRNIKNIVKRYKSAHIAFHQDLDGITSGIVMREYLKQYGLKTTSVSDIQYGDLEYTQKKISKDTLFAIVDFGHNKISAQIYGDHHDHTDKERKDKTKGQSKILSKSPSNVEALSMTISPRDIFPTKDIDIISMVDTAGYAGRFSADDVMRSVFNADKSLDVSKNHEMMGLVVNKLVLAYKNKKGFLDELVMTAKPSLISMYNTVVKMAKKAGYDTGKDMEPKTAHYKQQRIDKSLPDLKVSDIKNMKGGASGMIGTTIVQTGGGAMIPAKGNQYDRYAIFSIHPEGEYLVTEWPSMLNQLSKNPFLGKRNPTHLGDLVMKKIMPKFKSKLSSWKVSLDTLKYNFEAASMRKGGENDIMGFTFDDLMYLFEPQLKKITQKESWYKKEGKWEKKDNSFYKKMVQDITNRPYKWLSFKQKGILKKVTIPVWDVIMKQSGGHKDITNISLPHWLGPKKGEMAKVQREITIMMAKEMSDKHLE